MLDGIQKIYLLESNGFTVELSVSEKYDILTNASSVTVGLRIKSANQLGVQYLSGSIKIDGEKLLVMDSTVSTHNVVVSSYNTWYKVMRSSDRYTDSPWTKTNITHDPEGARDITVELEMRGYGLDNYQSLRVAATKTIVLTNIPRASKVTATDANIGAISTVSVIRRVPAYTHSVAYRFGTLSGYLSADGSVSAAETKLTETSIPFLLPESFYHQIPASPTGECSLTVKTYSGDQQIGDPQSTTFTVTAAKSLCQPQVWGSVEDVNAQTVALTGDTDILVRYMSDALCRIETAARNGASIVSRQIAGQKTEADERLLAAVEAGNISFRCTDSRGYSTSINVEKTLVPYIHLTADLAARRTDPTSGKAILEIAGNWFNGAFGAEENNLSAAYTVNGGDPVSIQLTADGNTYQATVELNGLDYLRSHTIGVTVSDRLQTVTKSTPVGKGIPVFDWDEDDFQFHVPVSLDGKKLVDMGDPQNDNDAVNLKTLRTLENVVNQKAPDKFGLGTSIPPTITDEEQLNACRTCGFYRYAQTAGSTICGIWFKYAGLVVYPLYGDECVQELRPLTTNYCLRRNWYNGAWSAWELVGVVQKLLWENASLSSGFPAQTLSLDLSGYAYVYVEAIRSYDSKVISGRVVVPVGGLSGYLQGSTNQFALTRREVTATTGGVAFSGFYSANTSNGNSNEIPYRIYGIKGVGK